MAAGRLDGRRALVTGGGRGIGAAVARALAAQGAHLLVLSRSGDEVRAVAADVAGTAIVADVGDREQLAAALATAGEIDILVANAGVVWPVQQFAGTDLDTWERAVEVNLHGAVRVVHALLPGMLMRGYGRIVTVSSGAASLPGMTGANAYSTSKAALDMFTVHLAGEIAGTGVTANAVRPGVVDTGMQDYMRSLPREQVGEAFHERFHGIHERGELMDPAVSAAFLVDVVLGSVNGQVLDVRKASGSRR
jgi:NAD(P)-dependent dehydrogenase (short-subunit alcohol dehydrogenase family)